MISRENAREMPSQTRRQALHRLVTRQELKSEEVKLACKPGSVQGRAPWAVIPLGRRLPDGSSNLPGSSASHAIAPLFGLAPDGVWRAVPVARSAVGSYPTVSPSPDPPPLRARPLALPLQQRASQAIGRLFSVPLSIASRRPAVSRHPALRSPDFPLRSRQHHAATARPASPVHPNLEGESPGAVHLGSPNFWLRNAP